MDGITLAPGEGEAATAPRPALQVMGQYVKDLSFENPGAPANLTQRPQVDVAVDVQLRRGEANVYELELKLRVDAKSDEKPLFLLELAYAGIFRVHNVSEDAIKQVLLVEASYILFPFARRIAADVVRDGGMPPLMIEPVDFVALYRSKMAAGTV